MDREDEILDQAASAESEPDAARLRAQRHAAEAERWEAEASVIAAHLAELESRRRSGDGRPERLPESDSGRRPPPGPRTR